MSGALWNALLAALIVAAILPGLLWLQGRWVRRRVPLLPEATGQRHGVFGAQPAAPLSLLIAGDSAAAGVGAEQQEQALLGSLLQELSENFEISYRLEARTGWKTSDLLAHLRELEPFPVDVAVLSLGVNDVTGGRTRRRFVAELEQLRLLLVDVYGCQTLLFSALPPMHRFPALPQPLRFVLGLRALAFSATLERYSLRTPGCRFVSAASAYRALPRTAMASDGFHPGPQIYRVWAQALAAHVDQLGGSAAGAQPRVG
jgi:lysophospholipase L1-like esterase